MSLAESLAAGVGLILEGAGVGVISTFVEICFIALSLKYHKTPPIETTIIIAIIIHKFFFLGRSICSCSGLSFTTSFTASGSLVEIGSTLGTIFPADSG